MPNYVSNNINIEGPKEDLAKFFEEVTAETQDTMEGTFSFRNLRSSSTGDNWYASNIENWGTKWDACDDYWENYGDGTGFIQFQTAWDIPIPIFKAMCGRYKTLSFTFDSLEEQGWGKKFYSQDGKLQLEEEWDIPTTHAEWIKLGEECKSCIWDDEDDHYPDCPKPGDDE